MSAALWLTSHVKDLTKVPSKHYGMAMKMDVVAFGLIEYDSS